MFNWAMITSVTLRCSKGTTEYKRAILGSSLNEIQTHGYMKRRG